jgi:Glycosyl transferase family 90
MSYPNVRYAVILLCLILLVTTTDVREWKSWFGGSSRSDLQQRDADFDQVRTAGRYASHDSDDVASATLPTYSTENIITTANSLVSAPARVLMYHPSNNSFTGYTVGPQNSTDPRMTKNANACLRCRNVLPILVDALLTSRPSRFQPDQPPFQLFFSIADFTASRCMYDDYDCSANANSFAPWLHFGSAFRDSTIVPRVQVMPLSNYLTCIMEWRLNNSIPMCTKWKLANATTDWNDLRPKVIWRGTGFPFLPDVGHKVFHGQNSTAVPQLPWEPRRVATNWSETSWNHPPDAWLDAKIVPWRRPEMTKEQLAQYKYQIDLAGVGGTTWTGCLDKLAMTGLLFHHETPTMDWFFKELWPWYHYVPVRTDLSDLKERFDWAEAHQDEAQQIAGRGRNFSTWFFSNQKMREEYEKLCDQLGKVVDAYSSKELSLESILDAYQKGSVFATPFSSCTKDYCDINTTPAQIVRYDIPPR